MDPAEFQALMATEQEKLGAPPAPANPAPQATTAAPTGPTLDLGALAGAVQPAPGAQPTAAPASPTSDGMTAEDTAAATEAGIPAGLQSSLVKAQKGTQAAPKAGDVIEAGVGGMAKGVFETKDFLFGDTPPAQQSAFRKGVEGEADAAASKSLLGGFSAGIGQFAIGMLGVGKLTETFKIGQGIAEVAPKAFSTLKAALAGSVAFDPHAARMSDMVQSTPLANPVNEWLSAKPDDSDAMGRLKNAFESIGMDATLGAIFIGASKVAKLYQAGDHAGALQAAKELDNEITTRGSIDNGGSPDEPTGGPTVEPNASAGTGEAAGTPPPAEGQPSGPPAQDVQAAGTETAASPTGGVDVPSAAKGDTGSVDGTVGEAPRDVGGGTPGDVGPATNTASAQSAAHEAGTQLNSAQPRIRVSVEDTHGLVQSMEDDAFAFQQFGGWYQALQGGHAFGKGEHVPWAKINLPDGGGVDPELQNFTARVADAVDERAGAIKGGEVLTDKRLEKVVGMMANLYNADPATIIGMVQRAGKDASTMVANMEAGYLISNRMLQDTHALAARISMGDFTEFGGFEPAMTELRKRASIAASVYASARSITAAGGRAVRRMRTEFAIDPAMVEKLNGMDSEQLLKVLSNTDGDPRAVAKVLNTSLWQKGIDALQFLYVNNLVSGWKTQLINFSTNTYMLGVRPLERILGGAMTGNSRVIKEAIKQYQYMGSSFTESFRNGGKAFLSNDSVLAPHKTDVRGTGLEGGADLRTILMGQKPWGSVGGLLANLTHISVAGIGLPTRVLGTVDEIMKQMTYRSKLQASAYMDAMDAGMAQKLTGGNLSAFVESFVKDKLFAGFDDAGKALDPKALREAQIATFQQDLLPGSLGRTLQNSIGKHPGLKLMVPFIKTPTNVMRYGWKMTPGLNLAQTEYREMLRGVHGAEAKAQAVGQMSMGLLFMGSAAYMVSQGTLTGGGPSDPKAKKALMATNWQPYSIVIPHDDGTKTYVPIGRLDPIAIPMGIIADLQDAYHKLNYEETPEFSAAVGSLLIAMSKQFTSKTYLLGISQFMDAMMDPDRNAQKVAGQTVSNFVPFSAMLRQTNPDPYLHDARDMTDKLLTTIPGAGGGVPNTYDPWGEPVERPGLWSSDDGSVVDHEVQRMAIETGSTIEAPAPVVNGVDLRELTLSTGENAYERYQQLAGNPGQGDSLKTIVARKIQTEAYQLAPDGDAGTKGTKLAILADIVSKRRQAAMKHLKQDAAVRDAFRSEDLKARAQYVKNKLDLKAQNSKATGLDALIEQLGQ